MVRFFRTSFIAASRRSSAVVLAFVLFCGFSAGAFLASWSGQFPLSLMRAATQNCVSIVNLFLVMLLPFLFTALAVYVGRLWLLFPIAFLKAFIFGYLGSCVLHLYGTSGWLIRFLLMFSDCLSLPVLCWFWLRMLCRTGADMGRRFLAAVCMLFGIVSLDYQFISPFLVDILS